MKKDTIWWGLLLGVLATALTYSFLYLIAMWTGFDTYFTDHRALFLLSFFPAIVLMRYYFVKKKFEKTGKGFLAIIFVGIILVLLLIK
jgi:drug/metabolite transporter (DMT)-like permease